MIQRKVFIAFLGSTLILFAVACGDSNSSKKDSDQAEPTDSDPQENATETETEGDTGPERPHYTPSTDSEEATEDTTPLTCIMTEPCGGSIPSERIECPYPLTPTMDGNLEDDAWQSASWEFMAHDAGNVNTAPDNDDDASMEFGCVADADYIYIAYRIHDDVIINNELSGCEVWDDDSVEFYIDACYERTAKYNGDDAQIAVGAENIGVTDQSEIVLGGCNGAPFQGPQTGSISYSVEMEGGWMGEIAIPLHPEGGWNIAPQDGQIIGFNTHYNPRSQAHLELERSLRRPLLGRHDQIRRAPVLQYRRQRRARRRRRGRRRGRRRHERRRRVEVAISGRACTAPRRPNPTPPRY